MEGAFLPLLMTPRKTWPLKLLMAAGMACMFGGPLMILAMAVMLTFCSVQRQHAERRRRIRRRREDDYSRGIWGFREESISRRIPVGLRDVCSGLGSVL